MGTIKIGGKERKFSLDFRSFRVAETRHGVRIKLEDFGNLGMGDFAKYLWIGLLAGDHDLTEEEVLKWLDGSDKTQEKAYLAAVMEEIGTFGSLFEEETPGKSEGKDGPSTGDTSSLSPTGS